MGGGFWIVPKGELALVLGRAFGTPRARASLPLNGLIYAIPQFMRTEI
jgi:hypothetical protein